MPSNKTCPALTPWPLRLILVLAITTLTWMGCVSHGQSKDGSTTTPSTPAAPERTAYFSDGPLSNARAHFDAGHWGKAATAFTDALDAKDSLLSAEERLRVRFLLGLSLKRADDHPNALQTFKALAEEDTLLTDYALLFAAESAFDAGLHSDATALAQRVDPSALLYGDALLVMGRARLADHRSQDAARTLTLAHKLAEADSPLRRDVEVELARAHVENGKLIAGAELLAALVDGHGLTAQGKEASELLTALMPKLSKTDRARFVRKKPSPSPLTKGRALYKKHRSKKAIPVFEALRKKYPFSKHPAYWCESSYLLAKCHSKLRDHKTAAPIYDEVISHCKDVEDYHLRATYNSGRAHWNADHQQKAIETYALLLETYPEHAYADDALNNTARIQFELDQRDEAIKTLEAQIRDYPDGDLAKDAHWMIFSEYYRSKRYKKALNYATAHRDNAAENDLYTRGRIAYFGVRTREQLKHKKPLLLDGYEAVIRDFPMSYYAMLAFGRLGDLSPERSRDLTASLREGPHDPKARIPKAPPALQQDPAFRRGRALLRLGLRQLGEQEFKHVQIDPVHAQSLAWIHADTLQGIGEFTRSHRKAAVLLNVNDAPAYFDVNARALWALAYPRPFTDAVWTQAKEQTLPPHLVYSIMREESAFNPTIESWANARGLMQLMLSTAQSTAKRLGDPEPTADDLFKPKTGIRLGAAYIKTLAMFFDHHPMLIVAGYNGGEGNVGRWLKQRGEQPLDLWVEDIPYGQTQRYTKRVLTSYWR